MEREEAALREFWGELLSAAGILRLRRGDHWDTVERVYHPEGVIDNFDESPFQGPYVGYAGLRRWAEEAMEALEEGAWWELEAVERVGDAYVCDGRVHGVWRVSGIELDIAFFSAGRFRDGRIHYTKGFLQREDAFGFARQNG